MSQSSRTTAAERAAINAKYALRDHVLPTLARLAFESALEDSDRREDLLEQVAARAPKWVAGATPTLDQFAVSEGEARSAGVYADEFGGSTLAVLRFADGSEWQLDVSVRCVVGPKGAQ